MSEAIKQFTTDIPFWRPYVTPIDLETASPEQLDALKVTPSNTKVSEYVLVLAHDPESLQHRTPLFNSVMYHRGGLSRPERELGAVGASVVNRCIYCTAVHASRYNQLTKDESAMERVFTEDENAALDARQSAILKFSAHLSQCPSEAISEDMHALVEAGLSAEDILDLILSAALFGWANRLMHTLGEPIAQEET
ncbi:MAG: alkylhydroperoxidase [Candidatus Entotheonella factor]|uniref:Alkylhydroperoxidase n=1 Tax=Entotheonella factor TaxID=1429438 RepID=W4LW90_ENTF1|nr:MAG: alkylhydroperoxidase [Candidatus Entotheonella factor]